MSIVKITQRHLVLYGIITNIFQLILFYESYESFKYKTSITGKRASNENTKDVEFYVPLKYLSNFWRTLDMPLINCEVNLILKWSKNYVLTDTATRDADPNPDLPNADWSN